ncbi:MAG: LuxR C-terminal-related transcriptional regulator [Acidimicrobiales bacterium]
MGARVMTKSDDPPGNTRRIMAIRAFAPPLGRSGEVVRPRLVPAVGTERSRPLVVVRAPAGYGKSTFAAQWCRSDDRPVSWLSLREADNDAVQLLSRVAAALEALEPVDAELVKALQTPTPRVEAALLPRFLDSLASRSPFLLALDDVHLLTSPSALAVLKGLAHDVPPGSQVVLVCRAEPPIGLARLRAAGDLHELQAADLALDEAETAELLAQAGVHLSPEEITELWTATEGWAAGLALAAMSRLKENPANPLASLSLGRRDIGDYFREEVLDVESDSVREFLIATSGVQRLCGPLCDAMTGRTDSADLLRELATTNLFVIPLDDDRRWFRYHHLFQDLLQAELEVSGEQRGADLLSRAAAWHEDHGDPSEAFEYAHRANDLDRAGRILLRHRDEYLGSGRIETVLRLLDLCQEEDIESDPQLAIAAAWVTGHAGDTERANRYLAAAERSPDLDRPSSDGATSLRAAVVNLRGTLGTRGAAQMLEDGRSVIDSELPERTRWLLGGYRNVGVAHLLLGHTNDAIDALSETIVLTEANPATRYVRMYCLGMLALAHGDLGDWARADRYTRQAEEILTGLEHNVQRLPVLVARAATAAHAGDASRAADALAQAREMMSTARAVPFLQAEMSLRCAEAAHSLGDDDAEKALVWDAVLASRRLVDPGSIPTRIADLQERMAGTDPLLALLSPAEKRVLRQLATHRTLQEIAEHLYVSRPTVKTHVAAIYSKLGVTTRAEAVAALGNRDGGWVIHLGDSDVVAPAQEAAR